MKVMRRFTCIKIESARIRAQPRAPGTRDAKRNEASSLDSRSFPTPLRPPLFFRCLVASGPEYSRPITCLRPVDKLRVDLRPWEGEESSVNRSPSPQKVWWSRWSGDVELFRLSLSIEVHVTRKITDNKSWFSFERGGGQAPHMIDRRAPWPARAPPILSLEAGSLFS